MPQGLWRYLLDGARAVPGGALSEGGNLFAWMEQTFKVPALRDADTEITKLPPDGHGLSLLPYVTGERSLGWHAEATGDDHGHPCRGQPRWSCSARGQEAVAYRLRAVYLRLMDALRPAQPPMVIGSGAALLIHRILQQVIADTLDVPLYPSRDVEASARGAALMALEALGIIRDVAAVEPHLAPPAQPDAARHAIYLRGAARPEISTSGCSALRQSDPQRWSRSHRPERPDSVGPSPSRGTPPSARVRRQTWRMVAPLPPSSTTGDSPVATR